MLRGEKVLLRARIESDVPILHEDLYDDVLTRSRADTRGWRPLSADSVPHLFGYRALPMTLSPFRSLSCRRQDLSLVPRSCTGSTSTIGALTSASLFDRHFVGGGLLQIQCESSASTALQF